MSNNNTNNTNNNSEPSAKRARTEPEPGVAPLYNQVTDPSTWVFNPQVTTKSTMIYIQDACKNKIKVQLPKMRVPFGVQEPKSDPSQAATSRPNLELDVSDPELVAWGDKIDDAVANYLHANSKEFFRKIQSKEVIGELYRHMIPKSDNDYNPLMRSKITRTGKYATEVFVVVDPGSETTPLLRRSGTPADIDRNDWVIPIVEIVGIWVANKAAGLSVGLSSVMVYKESGETRDKFNIPGVAGVETVKVEDESPEDSPTEVTEAATDDLISSDPFA